VQGAGFARRNPLALPRKGFGCQGTDATFGR
jgi:hypothetical protein